MSPSAVCGEMHYPRIPRASWRERMRLARSMGVEAISTYVFWNLHERDPGRYDFAENADVREYLLAAQEEGLGVVLRPGPYVCAEWDFGGLPAWLLNDPRLAVRTAERSFMGPVRRWLRRLGSEIAGLQAPDGPIVRVQLENEYGAFGSDRAYLAALREALIEAGFGRVPMFTIDQPRDLARGMFEGVAAELTFGCGDAREAFEFALSSDNASRPLRVAEYWAGWFDHWGEAHAQRDDEQQARELAWMLDRGAGVNIYMLAGGTNFGYWNGANWSEQEGYQPVTTSYDYDAAIDEAGRPREKFFAFREIVARATGRALPPVPAPSRSIAVPAFSLESCAGADGLLAAAHTRELPVNMEQFNAWYGYARYRTRLKEPTRGALTVEGLRDYACVLLDERAVAYLDRRLPAQSVWIDAPAGTILDLFVENCGRVNYGPGLRDARTGILGSVRVGDRGLANWEMRALGNDPQQLAFSGKRCAAPAFHRGTFQLEEPADTFLNVRALRKGALWVNGHHAGRFWDAGPQRRLYVPGSWLRRGTNVVIALDLFDHALPPQLHGEEGANVLPEA